MVTGALAIEPTWLREMDIRGSIPALIIFGACVHGILPRAKDIPLTHIFLGAIAVRYIPFLLTDVFEWSDIISWASSFVCMWIALGLLHYLNTRRNIPADIKTVALPIQPRRDARIPKRKPKRIPNSISLRPSKQAMRSPSTAQTVIMSMLSAKTLEPRSSPTLS